MTIKQKFVFSGLISDRSEDDCYWNANLVEILEYALNNNLIRLFKKHFDKIINLKKFSYEVSNVFFREAIKQNKYEFFDFILNWILETKIKAEKMLEEEDFDLQEINPYLPFTKLFACQITFISSLESILMENAKKNANLKYLRKIHSVGYEQFAKRHHNVFWALVNNEKVDDLIWWANNGYLVPVANVKSIKKEFQIEGKSIKEWMKEKVKEQRGNYSPTIFGSVWSYNLEETTIEVKETEHQYTNNQEGIKMERVLEEAGEGREPSRIDI
jgi:hypothetical protein